VHAESYPAKWPLMRTPASEPRAEQAQTRPNQPLTRELLDWAIASLEAVLTTPEVPPGRGVAWRLSDALKALDLLYPEVLKREWMERQGDVPARNGHDAPVAVPVQF
jgi:hypothetical protein